MYRVGGGSRRESRNEARGGSSAKNTVFFNLTELAILCLKEVVVHDSSPLSYGTECF